MKTIIIEKIGMVSYRMMKFMIIINPFISRQEKLNRFYYITHKKLLSIMEVYNESWKPNFDLKAQNKYYPYFELNKKTREFNPIGVFSMDNFTCNDAKLLVPYFTSREMADLFFTSKFNNNIYNELLRIENNIL